LFELLVREGDLRGRRVLDVGCGTGTLAAWLAERAYSKVWGVDVSAEMLAVARTKGVTVREAAAESLPFKDGWFERIVSTLVVHHLDRRRAFSEFRRVLGKDGRVAIATFAPEQFEQSYLNPFFPSIAVVDRERFGTPEQLVDQLREQGFADFTLAHLDQRSEFPREYILRRIRAKHISTFQLIPEDEYEAGVDKAERELPDPVTVEGHWLVVTAVRSSG
jgi:SAM-dependent methyltransferase